ncbi:hypothetical protein ARAM_003886 [Aspergillus rambellii]|uniref:ADP-ribosylhydrolase ARH3 n=1 Tax=Aspergillus rambellii TaxID=308745 RepID=A0A0F8WQE5_9EURO|nr:hypothetical protein ARAM_003886 [Aspergillus rambellii]
MVLSLRSRTLGSIWGVCVTDALGGPVQFSEPKSFEPITGLAFVAPFEQPAGSYSDDGAMTLALAKSFIDAQGKYDHELSIEYFVQWLGNGRFSTVNYSWDVGLSTRRALCLWRDHGTRDTEGTQRQVNHSLDKESSSGNGSLMRIASVGLVLWRDPLEARAVAIRQSRVTHPALACTEACEIYTYLMGKIMRGKSKEQLCSVIRSHKFKHDALALRMFKYKTLLDWAEADYSSIKSSGWVVDTLEAALWGFFKFNSYVDGALAVVNLGHDSDTVGAVYGGIAGAYYGYESIPADWIAQMQNQSLIGEIADGLVDFVVRE